MQSFSNFDETFFSPIKIKIGKLSICVPNGMLCGLGVTDTSIYHNEISDELSVVIWKLYSCSLVDIIDLNLSESVSLYNIIKNHISPTMDDYIYYIESVIVLIKEQLDYIFSDEISFAELLENKYIQNNKSFVAMIANNISVKYNLHTKVVYNNKVDIENDEIIDIYDTLKKIVSELISSTNNGLISADYINCIIELIDDDDFISLFITKDYILVDKDTFYCKPSFARFGI